MNMYGKLLDLLNDTNEVKDVLEEIRISETNNISLQFTLETVLDFLYSTLAEFDTLDQMAIAVEEATDKKELTDNLIAHIRAMGVNYRTFVKSIKENEK